MPETTSKPWWKSMTLWGAGLTILSVISPKYASIISPAISETGALIGAVTSIIGRLRKSDGTVPPRPPLE